MAELGEANIGGRMVPAWLLNLTAEELDSLKSRWYSNPNLLDNWYFGNPVNQRGKTEQYGSGYFIDRWTALEGKYALTNNGLTLCVDGVNSWITQRLDVDVEGQIITVSALASDGKLYTGTGQLTKQSYVRVPIDGGGYVSCEYFTEISMFRFTLARYDTTLPITILAAKLELGPTQTLAHREGDKWVLNEIPDYGEQLRRCQRHCRVYKAGEYLPCLAYAESDGWYLSASMYIGDMRTTPINNLGSGLSCSVSNIDGGTSIDKTITNWGIVGSTIQRLRISGGDTTPGPFPYNVMPKQDLIFSADL